MEENNKELECKHIFNNVVFTKNCRNGDTKKFYLCPLCDKTIPVLYITINKQKDGEI